MRTRYDTLYLSPHLDDAVFSCGGQIAAQTRQGRAVLVATVCAGDLPPPPWTPLAASMLAHWQLKADGAAVRRAEDAAACALLDADFTHGPFLEAVHLTDRVSGAPLYPTLRALLGPMHPQHRAAGAALADWLRQLPPCGRIVIPLALGGHADHRWVRAAAEACFGARVVYYEDYPYAQRWFVRLAQAARRCRQPREIVALSAEERQRKFEASAAYVSQARTIFGDRAGLEFQMGRYLCHAGGERLWSSRTGFNKATGAR